MTSINSNLTRFSMKSLIMIVLSLSLCFSELAFSAEKLKGKQDPIDAHLQCTTPSGIAQLKWAKNGHLHGSYYLALIAGSDPKRAYRIAYYSQYPDIDIRYDAISVAKEYHLKLKNPWRNNVMEKLHSLHGQGVVHINQLRNRLYALLGDSLKNPRLDWYSGILLHSLGDSYAHTKGVIGSGTETAYGPIFGHALSSFFGADPDDILHRGPKEKYLRFIEDFNSRLMNTTNVSADNFDLQGWELIKDEMPRFAEPYETLRSAVINNCLGQTGSENTDCDGHKSLWGDFSKNKSNDLEDYMQCMNIRATPISKDNIIKLINDIEGNS